MTAPRWIDDPWSALTTGEDAWRAGYEAARAQAVKAVRQEAETMAATRRERLAMVWAAAIVEAMEPPPKAGG